MVGISSHHMHKYYKATPTVYILIHIKTLISYTHCKNSPLHINISFIVNKFTFSNIQPFYLGSFKTNMETNKMDNNLLLRLNLT